MKSRQKAKASEGDAAAMKKLQMSRVLGFVYLYLSKPVFEQFGMEGEKTIRQAVRAFGKFRGQCHRKWHVEEGLPLNLESFIIADFIGSVQGSGALNPETVITPYFVEFTTTHCSLIHDVCKDANFEHWGYIYCDEMHQELLQAYHPKAIVEIHENLMKGDDGCHFRWMMPAELADEKIDRSRLKKFTEHIEKDEIGFRRFMLWREGYLSAMLYFFLARTIIDRFGRAGRSIIESSLIEIGRKRGRELRQRLKKSNLAPTWKNIWDEFDQGYKYSWEMKVKSGLNDNLFRATISNCPMAKVWNEVGDQEIGPLFCDTVYGEIFKELNPKVEIRIPQCMSKGHRKCRFEFII